MYQSLKMIKNYQEAFQIFSLRFENGITFGRDVA